MALKLNRRIFLISLIAFLCLTILPANRVHALATDSNGVDQSFFDTFVKQVQNGHVDELRGLYIPDILAVSVIQQPAGMNNFVSSWEGVATQFKLASKLGSTGLLAHNDLAGKSFALLQKGQKLYLIYGNGQVSTFVVSEILHYQALQSTSPLSSFLDLDSHKILTTSELFTKIYGRRGQVILQTCIDLNHNPAWGRLFVIAQPASVEN